MKFILGVLNGRWVVHTSWVEACLAAGRPVSEAEHEVAGDSTGKLGGPLLGRLQAGLKLLLGWEVMFFIGCYQSVRSTPQVADVILLLSYICPRHHVQVASAVWVETQACRPG